MAISKNFIAYKVPKFNIEWDYTEDRKIPALEYFNSREDDEKIKTLNLFKLMATEGKGI